MRLQRKVNSVGRHLFSSSLRCLAVSSVLLGAAIGQEVGVDLCGCSPGTYEFTFDFSLACPPVNITRNGGVAATFCQISPFNDGGELVTDFVPVSSSLGFSFDTAFSSRQHSNPICASLFKVEVGSVSVIELGQDFSVLIQTSFNRTFLTGDSFIYTSIVADQDEDIEANKIPKAIQLNISALNAEEQTIFNFFAIAFTNDCAYPAIDPGNSAGWTSFVSCDMLYRRLTLQLPMLTALLLYFRLLFHLRLGTCVQISRLFLQYRQP
jgi:hypothetical protein